MTPPTSFHLKAMLKRIPGYYILQDTLASRRQEREHRAWIAAGRPVPPPHLAKRKVLLELARKHGCRILVETGTYYGEMIAALRTSFEDLYTIELSVPLHALARRRFKGDAHIRVLQGDSGEVISTILPKLDRPTLFWLDGHYSSGITAMSERETPILQELEHILSAPDLGHVLVVDDARDFGSDPGYPTLEALRAFVHARRPSLEFSVDGDAIRFEPRERANGT